MTRHSWSFRVRGLTIAFAATAAVFAGCDRPMGSTAPSTSGAGLPTAAWPPAEADTLAMLKMALDSWVFGDSLDKWKADHPDVTFNDIPCILRDKVLLRYEVGAARAKEDVSQKGHKLGGTEYAVALVFSSRAGTELKESRVYQVFRVKDTNSWTVTGMSK